MAKVSNPLIGSASGSVGGTTFSNWKSIKVLKTKSQGSSKAPTSNQIDQRNRFKNCLIFFQLWRILFENYLTIHAVNKTNMNVFQSWNVSTFSVNNNDSVPEATTAFKFSSGNLASFGTSGVLSGALRNLTITCDISENATYARPTDEIDVFILNNTKSTLQKNSFAFSEAFSQVVNVVDGSAGDQVVVYLSVRSDDYKKQSNTLYVDTVNLLS